MKNYFKVYTLFIIILSIGCEDVEVAVPGNNQNPESVAPIGTIIWDVNNFAYTNRGCIIFKWFNKTIF